jgi:ER-bound oxygenase mpaB/B'/Rubber oxygenase, catalytic domain
MGSSRVAETLSRTGGFGIKVARRRLLETFQHILQVTRDIESVKPGGEGFASSIRVRFLHAAVRRRILQLAKENTEYFDVEGWGVPVNDLDAIGTITSFSSTLIWLGFPRQGILLRQQEIADYLALWRWIAHIIGTPTSCFATPARAKAMLESLMLSEIQPSETSRILASNILTGMSAQPPMFASREFLAAEAYWLNGSQLSHALAISAPSLYHSSLVLGQCLFFMASCYTYRSIPSWDQARNKVSVNPHSSSPVFHLLHTGKKCFFRSVSESSLRLT